MHAMVLNRIGAALEWTELPDRHLGPGEIRVAVRACGVCRTDLHVLDGELPKPVLPIIPGHEIVGRIDDIGVGVAGLAPGQRVGIPWLGHTCGACPYCKAHSENLCDRPLFTGYTRDGGFATSVVADARFAFPLGEHGDDASLAPLLCAGLIGWRSLRVAGDGKALGLYGFGAAAHILAQVAQWQGREVFAFTRPGDTAAQGFARSLGVAWAGGSDEAPPKPLDAAIIFATDGGLVPQALEAVRKGGTVVCAGIHMSVIPAFPYELLWEERRLLSVANLTREDGLEFLRLVPEIGIVTLITRYSLQQANEALADPDLARVQRIVALVSVLEQLAPSHGAAVAAVPTIGATHRQDAAVPGPRVAPRLDGASLRWFRLQKPVCRSIGLLQIGPVQIRTAGVAEELYLRGRQGDGAT